MNLEYYSLYCDTLCKQRIGCKILFLKGKRKTNHSTAYTLKIASGYLPYEK